MSTLYNGAAALWGDRIRERKKFCADRLVSCAPTLQLITSEWKLRNVSAAFHRGNDEYDAIRTERHAPPQFSSSFVDGEDWLCRTGGLEIIATIIMIIFVCIVHVNAIPTTIITQNYGVDRGV